MRSLNEFVGLLFMAGTLVACAEGARANKIGLDSTGSDTAFASSLFSDTADADADQSRALVRLQLSVGVSVALPKGWSIVVGRDTLVVDDVARNRIRLYAIDDDPFSVRSLIVAFVQEPGRTAAVNILRTEGGHEGDPSLVTAELLEEIESGARQNILNQFVPQGCAIRWLPTLMPSVASRRALELNYLRTCGPTVYRVRQTTLFSRDFGVVMTQSAPRRFWDTVLHDHDLVQNSVLLPP